MVHSMLILTEIPNTGKRGINMAAPTPDDLEQLGFWIQNWQYFMAGLASLTGAVYVVKKGKSAPVIIPLSEAHIDNKLTIHGNELKDQIKKEIKEDLRYIRSDFNKDLKEVKEDMLREIELMIKAKT